MLRVSMIKNLLFFLFGIASAVVLPDLMYHNNLETFFLLSKPSKKEQSSYETS